MMVRKGYKGILAQQVLPVPELGFERRMGTQREGWIVCMGTMRFGEIAKISPHGRRHLVVVQDVEQFIPFDARLRSSQIEPRLEKRQDGHERIKRNVDRSIERPRWRTHEKQQ